MRVIYTFCLLIFVCLAILNAGCKEDDPGLCNGKLPISFISLVAANDTIETGESTTVTASAEGYELTYEWTASKGYIFPGESENIITYTASPCALGEITITCKADDACGNSVTKKLIIVVL